MASFTISCKDIFPFLSFFPCLCVCPLKNKKIQVVPFLSYPFPTLHTYSLLCLSRRKHHEVNHLFRCSLCCRCCRRPSEEQVRSSTIGPKPPSINRHTACLQFVRPLPPSPTPTSSTMLSLLSIWRTGSIFKSWTSSPRATSRVPVSRPPFTPT